MTVLWFNGKTDIEEIAEVFGCSNDEAYEKLEKMRQHNFTFVDPPVIIYTNSEVSDDELEWIGNDVGKELKHDDDCADLVAAMTKAKLITDDQALKMMFHIVKVRV